MYAEGGVRNLCDVVIHTSKVAIVMGREVDGVSQEMLTAADERIYIPMVGFTESFNLSVATALVLQRVFSMASTSGTTLHGDLSIEGINFNQWQIIH